MPKCTKESKSTSEFFSVSVSGFCFIFDVLNHFRHHNVLASFSLAYRGGPILSLISYKIGFSQT